MAAPRGAEVEHGVTAVPCGTEVLHVYATGLNGGHRMTCRLTTVPLPSTFEEPTGLACRRCSPRMVAKVA